MIHRCQPQTSGRHQPVEGPQRGVVSAPSQGQLQNVHPGITQMRLEEVVPPYGYGHPPVAHLHAYSAVDPAVTHSAGQEARPNRAPFFLAIGE